MSSDQPNAPIASGSGSGSNSSASSSSAVGGQVRVFLPPTSSTSSTTFSSVHAISEAEEDLKPTPEELKTAFRSTLLQRNGPDAPLLTRALRERQEAQLGLHSSRNRTWDNVRIRIRFSDRTMIEKSFRESDTIDSVYAFLDECLDDTAKGKAVVIYTAPPKVEYKEGDKKVKGKTLRELGLIPSAVVSLKWDEAGMNSPLKSELKHQAKPLTPPPSFDQPSPSPTPAQGSPSKEAKPMPKWLKNIVSKSSQSPPHTHTHPHWPLQERKEYANVY
ncbi:uncharacterized protein UTRI_05687_B [Ustilago trichophora]|uniref:UBX domain-containing protein n=1 Tax=Ustilago trichophora TaxID=86804 RepID=A0A5C3EQD8_9BASI|nr:uncharacterized protein UTRI_05687_B [Ustilago trichophora]